jgi:ABC-type nitrate/sulfonate/bicarbonate transport system substrate-binding protein
MLFSGTVAASCSGGAPADVARSELRDGAKAPAATTIRYTDPVNVDVRDIPILIALDDLESRGYRIERSQVAGPPIIADMLARGQTDIGVLNNQTMWSAVAKGAAVWTVMQFAAPTTVLAAQRSIKACSELDGKRMGVSGTAGLSQVLIQIYLRRRCSNAAPELIVIAESSGRRAALLAGRLDAAVMPGEELIKLQLQAPGRLHALMTHAAEYSNLHIDAFQIRRAWAEDHPGSVRDFLRAVLIAQRRITADPALLYAEAQKRLGIDEQTARAIGESHLRAGIWNLDGGLTAADIQETIDFLVKAEVLPAGLTVTLVSNLSYLDDVLDEIGRAGRR